MTTMPLTAAPCIGLWEVNGNTVNLQSGTTGVASLISVIDGKPAKQATAANQPVLNIDTTNKLRGYTEMDFDASRYLSCNDIASVVTNAGPSMTMAFVAACSDPTNGTAMTALSLAHSSGTSKIDIFCQSSDAKITITNAAGVSSTTAASLSPVLDTAAHVYTVLFDKTAGTLKVRFDAVEVISVSSLSGTFTFDTFTIGGLVTGSFTRGFKGTIGPVAMYLGSADIKLVEDHLYAKYVKGAFLF